jgi:hypothetical protein
LSIRDEFQQASVQHVCPNGGMCCSDVFFIAGCTPWFKSPITGFSDGFFLPIAYPMASGCIMLCGRFFLPAGTVVSTRWVCHAARKAKGKRGYEQGYSAKDVTVVIQHALTRVISTTGDNV